MSDLLKDINGATSSKRVGGMVLVVAGIVAGFIGAFIGNALLVDYSKWITGEGVLLLGIGVLEKKND